MNKYMRILVFFDLPVITKEERRIATNFRKFLIKDGYHMLQYSVYARVCNGTEASEKHISRLKGYVPAGGSIRMMLVTEKQYEAMLILSGKKKYFEKPLSKEQFTLF